MRAGTSITLFLMMIMLSIVWVKVGYSVWWVVIVWLIGWIGNLIIVKEIK